MIFNFRSYLVYDILLQYKVIKSDKVYHILFKVLGLGSGIVFFVKVVETQQT